jgi:hypothetical protein
MFLVRSEVRLILRQLQQRPNSNLLQIAVLRVAMEAMGTLVLAQKQERRQRWNLYLVPQVVSLTLR